MKKLILYCLLIYAISVTTAFPQRLQILSESIVGPLQSGLHGDWYDIEADPDNANNLIACGMKWDAIDNANYGYVYASQDGGKVWHTALEDKSSKFVSEESCAFGVHGVVYFVADASQMIDNIGFAHHEHGTTRIWVSHDSGKSWTLGTTTGWTDCSSSVVDRNPGPDQNRLYIFFNGLWTYYTSVDDKQALAKLSKAGGGSSIGLISYRDGDKKIDGPLFDPEMYKQLYHGSYTTQNMLLKDGSLLTMFWSHTTTHNSNGKSDNENIFAAQRTDPQRNRIFEPVNIYSTTVMPRDGVCTSAISAPAAYDSDTNTVYVAYLDGSNEKCTLMLAKSSDNGQTWSSSVWTEQTGSGRKDPKLAEQDYRSLAMARREDGTLVLLWRNDAQSDCWVFATSVDNGKTYSHPQPIATCSTSDGRYHVASEFLDSLYISQADEEKPTDHAGLMVKNHFDMGKSHNNGIAVTPDGIFHPVWVADGGQLYTAAIGVTKLQDRNRPEPTRTDGWRLETNKVKFTYGGSQHYDEQNKILTESVVILNSAAERLKGPMRLEIVPNSRVGIIYPLDAVTEGSGDGIAQYLDIDQYISADGLAPGASSEPIPLRFHFEPYSEAGPGGGLASVSLRILTKEIR